jgi:hypothetical protein
MHIIVARRFYRVTNLIGARKGLQLTLDPLGVGRQKRWQ